MGIIYCECCGGAMFKGERRKCCFKCDRLVCKGCTNLIQHGSNHEESWIEQRCCDCAGA